MKKHLTLAITGWTLVFLMVVFGATDAQDTSGGAEGLDVSADIGTTTNAPTDPSGEVALGDMGPTDQHWGVRYVMDHCRRCPECCTTAVLQSPSLQDAIPPYSPPTADTWLEPDEYHPNCRVRCHDECDEVCDYSDRVDILMGNMASFAEQEGFDLQARFDAIPNIDPQQLAEWSVVAGRKYGVDPLLIVLISYHESRWSLKAVGDQGRSCGLMQVIHCKGFNAKTKPCGTGWPNRPTCDRLKREPYTGIDYAAGFLRHWTSRGCDGSLCLYRYWGIKNSTTLGNEAWVWRRYYYLKSGNRIAPDTTE